MGPQTSDVAKNIFKVGGLAVLKGRLPKKIVYVGLWKIFNSYILPGIQIFSGGGRIHPPVPSLKYVTTPAPTINFLGNVVQCPQHQFLKTFLTRNSWDIYHSLCSSPWTTYVLSCCLYIYKQNERTYVVQGEEHREWYIYPSSFL